MKAKTYVNLPLPNWPTKLKILVFHPNEGGCAYYRSLLPNRKLLEHFPNLVSIRFNRNPLGIDENTGKVKEGFDFEDIRWADVVLINNMSNFGGPYTAAVLNKAKELKKFVHFDTDDLLTELYPEHRLYEVYKNNKLDEITKYIYANSDLVTVTQRKFAERVSPYCSKIIAIVKNSIDYNLPTWNLPKVNHAKKIHVGWAGGIHHRPDVVEFASVPHLVNQKVGREKVFWDFYGLPKINPNDEKERWQVEAWQEYKNVLLKGFKGQPNWSIHHARPPDDYGAFYANMDIAIAPLRMNNFNDSKSEIKVAECGRYKVPLVASNVGCYDETIINGQTGYLIDPDASKIVWVRTLSNLIKNPKKIREMGENLHSVTEAHFDINKIVRHRLSLYEQCFVDLNYNVFQEPKEEEN